MEKHFWIMGEQFTMVVAAEKNFEHALRELRRTIGLPRDNRGIEHEDRYKEMDILLVRQDRNNGTVHNVVLELKHPSKKLGKKFVAQIEAYCDVIESEPRFNGSNMYWSYYLIGNQIDDSGFIENRIENAKPHGEADLIYKVRNHRIYVKKWSDIIQEAELRHQFLNDRLQIERDSLSSEEMLAKSADEIISRSRELSCATIA
jgi:hypothetical protein